MNRRGFLGGMAGILAAGVAPAFITDAMRVRPTKSGLLVAERRGIEPCVDRDASGADTFIITSMTPTTMTVRSTKVRECGDGSGIPYRVYEEGHITFASNALPTLDVGDTVFIVR